MVVIMSTHNTLVFVLVYTVQRYSLLVTPVHQYLHQEHIHTLTTQVVYEIKPAKVNHPPIANTY